ncbi:MULTISPECIES: penicillin-insensitive murein endopeptidase [unclassified Rhizobium]|uniref:penicillin-insensitive murein endopeptidase n=1 Tax=unclassified Rhizobium TaxID=2613769 RepID=UPI0006F20947|nr:MULTISPECIES: penicillin-insensitive murein endopeptidase [unclassified Rhizobium]KQV44445.1 peptidase [Rhizobium sp. Root1212]KRD38626.1 peptidase [Rhizobium sp. Root268]
MANNRPFLSPRLRRTISVLTAALIGLGSIDAMAAEPAKQIFGKVTLPSEGAPSPIGFYAKGCMAGAVAIPTDGPTWQAMRLSRNRRWGNPAMIQLLERFSQDAAGLGWGSGILIGDISQPRGGPMLTGHASHQIGLDADIWFTPKPAQPLTAQQREDMPFTSMLDKSKFLTVSNQRWTPTHARLVMQAASYPQVERVFVNPAIKKKLCDTWTGDRSLLGKVRPVYGHDEHFHIRIHCPEGAPGCKPQAPVAAGDGCDKSLAWWFTKEPWATPKKDPNAKPVKPKFTTLADLPKACSAVLAAPANSEAAATYGTAYTAPAANTPSIEAVINASAEQAASDLPVPVPTPRPLD